jgi:hypothetical protein
MKKTVLHLGVVAALGSGMAAAPAMADDSLSFSKVWTFSHGLRVDLPVAPGTPPNPPLAEIVSFDSLTKTLWVAGVSGVDVLDAKTGARVAPRIDTTGFGSINSVAISNGLAAFAIEAGPTLSAPSATRADPGVVKLYDTTTRTLASGVNSIAVGSLPDMLTFTKDGSKLLVANEGTPNVRSSNDTDYGARTAGSTVFPRVFGAPLPGKDPVGSVSIIDMGSRAVVATANPNGVTEAGSNIRKKTGMDFEPEYIAVNSAGTKAFVSLQEANAIGVLNLTTNTFDKVIGLGAKDFSKLGNEIDPLNNNTVSFGTAAAKGLYMPDGVSVYEKGGKTFVLTANEGDFREDDGDRSPASTVSALNVSPLNNLRVSNTDSSGTDLYAAGARSFSIWDEDGKQVFDSGSILDKAANDKGVYDDVRSRDKGVEPEGIEVMEIGDRTFALVGLERTKRSSIGIFDITDPMNVSFIDLLVADAQKDLTANAAPDFDLSPEGLEGFEIDGNYYIAYSNEVSNTTSVYQLTPIPEPETYALMLMGLAAVGAVARRRRQG